ncbi:DNA adenine methylase [Mycolicibacterium rutilum]|uniref:Site-specific DNA-methyltransferase (adenine-specific) n=1 Tax=Mycolicibacterium rutilum TaxID=370526 RepID=A0A1H6JZL5_MYCRU|nr:DNA adenine methylase [Mycolicibacterium rutilum]
MADHLLKASNVRQQLRPLLKWAGGKQWLAPSLAQLYNISASTRLIEPFAGGAALYFAAGPERAVLGDANRTLISTYRTLTRHPAKVFAELGDMRIDADTFYRIRAERPALKARIAARMIYLNRTAFGGIWRVNARGEFNVPYGCKPETSLPTLPTLRAYSIALKRAKFYASDFEETFSEPSGPADFIYCDPPYTVTHNNNGFLRYNETIFRWNDQLRLADLCNSAASRGRRVVVSNAAHRDVIRLYDKSLFFGFVIQRNSNLAPQIEYRKPQDELLLVSKSLGFTRQRISNLLQKMELLQTTPRSRGLRW